MRLGLLQERLRREEQTARRIREQKEHEVKNFFKLYLWKIRRFLKGPTGQE